MLGGCRAGDATGPQPVKTGVSFKSVSFVAPVRDSAVISSESQFAIDATGFSVLGFPCHTLSASSVKQGALITVTVELDEAPSACTSASGFDYTVHLRDVAPGAYKVEVVHRSLKLDGRVAVFVAATDSLAVR
jgi:hypothetical protein